MINKDLHKRILIFTTLGEDGSGQGGHFYSINSYYQSLKLFYSVDIVLLKTVKNKTCVLENLISSFLIIYQKNEFNNLEALCKSKNYNYSINFSDDKYSHLLRVTLLKSRTKVFFVRPGGGKHGKLIPLYPNLIVFSNENVLDYRHFSRKIFLIKNRIDKFECSKDRILEFEKKYPKKDLNIVRVSRINERYKEVFDCTINFHKILLEKGFNVQTHLVGFIQSEKVNKEIKEKLIGINNIFLINDPNITHNFKELLCYYNLAIGIGRGFWEAVSVGIPVLGYSKNNSLPIVVNNGNIENVSHFNFSTRYVENNRFSIDKNLEIITNQELIRDYINYQKEYFQKEYSCDGILEKVSSAFLLSDFDSKFRIAYSLLLHYIRVLLKRK